MPSFLSPPPRRPKHTEEQLKLAANICHVLAVTIFAAFVIAPLASDPGRMHVWVGVVVVLVGGLLESIAFALLRFIPAETSTERK